MFCAYTRPRYQVSVYRTNYRTFGPLVSISSVEVQRSRDVILLLVDKFIIIYIY